MVGPFIFFDHMGPAIFPPALPARTDVRPHPHIGLSTITYLFAGEIVHRDSVGCYQVIRPGEVNWMTAGRGITHSERFETMREHGGRFTAFRRGSPCPRRDEETDPAFVHFAAASCRTTRPGAAITSDRRISVRSCQPGARRTRRCSMRMSNSTDDACIDIPDVSPERAVFVAAGRAVIESATIDAGQMAVFDAGRIGSRSRDRRDNPDAARRRARRSRVTSIGISSRLARSASNKRSQTGAQGAFRCLSMTTRNSSRCPMTHRPCRNR